ncbi:hypothetical protein WJX84_006475 [Apatococcus fuscideae]|uniref:BSD domain-containing protein n=1 Tax=Apatococcus fuscideae TaxID=2026836 RepID=A0AAW1SXS7_9CHLO
MLDFFSTLQGQQDASRESTDIPSGGSLQEDPSSSRTKTAEAPSFSFWGVATALTESVKKSSADLASSVRETDWRAELNAFRQGVTEESQQLTAHTAAAVEKLPVRATQATSNIQLQLAGPEMQARLAKAGVNIEKFARKVAYSSGELFEDVKETILAELGPKGSARSSKHSRSGSHSSKPTQLEADVAAMQRDSATYCEQPAASAEYATWLADFTLDSCTDEIAIICQENAFMSELQTRIVPLIVSHDMFWTRYFWRLHLLQTQSQQCQQLTQHAASKQEEQDDGKDKQSTKPEISTAASQPPQHDAESASQVAAAVVAHQQMSSESGRSPGHSREASRAATEADRPKQKPAQPGQHAKQEEGEDDDLSELSGSEAEGPMSGNEEDWGTWE